MVVVEVVVVEVVVVVESFNHSLARPALVSHRVENPKSGEEKHSGGGP